MRRRPRSGENPPPPPRKADLRRADLVRAAITLLIDQGLPDSPVDDIAAHAAVAKGTFYHYFASKTDLIEALRAHFNDDFQARVVAAVDVRPIGDWNGRFEAWIVTATDSYFDMHALHDLVFHGPTMPHRRSMGDADIVRPFAALLAAGQAAGAWFLGNEEPIQVAALIFHGLHGMVDDALASGALSDRMGTRIARLARRMLAS